MDIIGYLIASAKTRYLQIYFGVILLPAAGLVPY